MVEGVKAMPTEKHEHHSEHEQTQKQGEHEQKQEQKQPDPAQVQKEIDEYEQKLKDAPATMAPHVVVQPIPEAPPPPEKPKGEPPPKPPEGTQITGY
jgi:hypothetical protein